MNEQQTINFVLEVKKYPCLYNSSLSSYYRRTETDKAWEVIGKLMNMTGIACKEKWRNLRVVFMRHMKISRNGSGHKKKKPYYLLDVMQFLTPHLKQTTPNKGVNFPSTSSNEGINNIDDIIHAQELSNIHEDESASENTEEYNEPRSPKTKRNRLTIQEADKQYITTTNRPSTLNEYRILNDPVISFLNSLEPELKEMNLQQLKIFKRKVLALIDDIMGPCGNTPTATDNNIIDNNEHVENIPNNSKNISVSESNCMDVGDMSPENNSNCSSPTLFFVATDDDIKTEVEP
ncbi:uncharacterized protein LOC128673588 [Plodia interpunctella]|uniref:uncharacterized protein LOC128673588 n=1 Tax=Plodia interpunctella TaxID=58824 RepID=UPI0023678F92|nr:uncharacterized protein LOC128673588 [Plodia interpunctella]